MPTQKPSFAKEPPSQCTKNQSGRLIERNEHQAAVERNKQRIEQDKKLYRKRQAIEEEMSLVNANKKLIEIFEKKIKDKISEVWGVETITNYGSQLRIKNGIPNKKFASYVPFWT
jgi:hypothetical protein